MVGPGLRRLKTGYSIVIVKLRDSHCKVIKLHLGKNNIIPCLLSSLGTVMYYPDNVRVIITLVYAKQVYNSNKN